MSSPRWADDGPSSPPHTAALPLSPLSPQFAGAYASTNRSPTTISMSSIHFDEEDELNRPTLLLQPASPAVASSSAFQDVEPSSPPPPTDSPSVALPTLAPSGLAARRAAGKNKKMLSLVVPPSAASPALASPVSPGLMPGGASSAETRSLPPSPVSLVTYIGVEGSEMQDRLIGRLMLKQQADEMREALKGGRSMKRRTSIPQLGLGGQPNRPAPLNLGSTNGGSAVKLIRRDNIEQSGLEGGKGTDADEDFPYAQGPREILPGIWLGSEQNARDSKVLQAWGITHVLNVAKEVECPWIGEELDEGLDSVEMQPQASSSGEDSGPEASTSNLVTSTPTPPRGRHRRTKTQGGASLVPTVHPRRPVFVRPTVSTPNLLSVFKAHAATSSSSLAVVVPSPVAENDDLEALTMTKSLSAESPTSSFAPRPRPPPIVTSATPVGRASSSSTLFPANRQTGRPAIEYLWLKWGHDEADLVEASKFQQAFDFLDEARREAGQVLVHCQCGVSRSATVVIAYCMREAAKALDEGREVPELAAITGMHDAYSFVKEKSEWVGPNLCLVFQLVAFERTLRGGPLDLDEDEAPPFPQSPRSPHTPLTSEGSSDAQLSTPELHTLLTSSARSSPPEFGSAPSLDTVVVQDGDDNDELLSPLADALVISERDEHTMSPKGAHVASPGVFVLPMPQRRPPQLSPLLIDDSPTSPTPYSQERRKDEILLPRLSNSAAFALPVSTTISPLAPTPVTTIFPSADPPPVTQFSLAMGGRGLPRIPQSPVDGLPRLFGTQTPTERRASHRRVFSWSAQGPAP